MRFFDLPFVACLATLSGCVVGPGNDAPADASTTADDTADATTADPGTTAALTTGSGPTAPPETTGGPATTGIDSNGDTDTTTTTTTAPADTDSDSSTTEFPETGPDTEAPGTESDSDTDAEVPPECLMPDPAVDAAFTIDVSAWDDEFFDDVPCTITAVAVAAGDVVTELECESDAMSLPTTFTIADAPEGPVTWAPGDAVRLTHASHFDIRTDGHGLQMRPADDPEALLVSVVDHYLDEGIYGRFKPLTLDLERACPPGPFEVREAVSTWTVPEGTSVEIFSRHRDVLPGEPGWTYVIDVELADFDPNHGEGSFKILVRRVAL